ncbi:UNVERIFIED_CONTAM: hypothetical protein FKN15_042075 [Acipenser sinensis]
MFNLYPKDQPAFSSGDSLGSVSALRNYESSIIDLVERYEPYGIGELHFIAVTIYHAIKIGEWKAREAPESPAPEELLQGEQEEETIPEPEDPALVSAVPCPLLLDTLPVFLDLPTLGLEPRSLHHRPQLCPWFPTPLSLSTQTSLGCCKTSLVLPLFAAKLPLGDRTSLRRSPGEDLCPLLQPPVPRPSLRSALLSRWGPMSPVQGPFLEAPEEPTHPQARPCKRVKIYICGLEGIVCPGLDGLAVHSRVSQNLAIQEGAGVTIPEVITLMR